jgi:hypothetical protein
MPCTWDMTDSDACVESLTHIETPGLLEIRNIPFTNQGRARGDFHLAISLATRLRQRDPAASKSMNTNPRKLARIREVSPCFRSLEYGGMGRAGLEPATPAFSMPCSTN